MRDPRNWARPAAAVVVGSVAAGGLVLVRARQQQKKRQATRPARAREVDPRRRGRHREAPARLGARSAARVGRVARRRGQPRADARDPDQQVEEVVLGVHRDQVEDLSPSPAMKPESVTSR